LSLILSLTEIRWGEVNNPNTLMIRQRERGGMNKWEKGEGRMNGR
jgi:hypothetical protein